MEKNVYLSVLYIKEKSYSNYRNKKRLSEEMLMEEGIDSYGEGQTFPIRQKRTFLDIVNDILSSIPQSGIKPTHLANKAMLDYKILLKYLKQLEKEGHIAINGKIYITDKGKEFLEEYKKLKELVNSERNN